MYKFGRSIINSVNKRCRRAILAPFALAVCTAASLLMTQNGNEALCAPAAPVPAAAGATGAGGDTPSAPYTGSLKNLPVYRQTEVARHTSEAAGGVWVTYKDGVYDITSFIASHPGGEDKIKLAAGKAVEPFWRLYRQHYESKLPFEIMAGLRVGTLHPDDVKANNASARRDESDPYKDEPETSPVLNYQQRRPTNAEPPVALLTESFLTPNDLWFIRNHHPVPKIDESTFRLSLSTTASNDGRSFSYSLADLRSRFRKVDVVSSIQCGGNRRAEMSKIVETAGKPWDVSAIGTAKWSGVRLADVIADSLGYSYEGLYAVLQQMDDAQAQSQAQAQAQEPRQEVEKPYIPSHVHFTAADGLNASIPIKKALDYFGDVLLAYEMNGQPLPREHGYPLRVVVPGHVGIRNVKWVQKIELSDREAVGAWQSGMAYKGFGPNVTSLAGIDTAKIQSLQEQPVQSAITYPVSFADLEEGTHTVRGYAYSGGGRKVIRVDVSADGGNTWKQATLLDGSEQPADRAWAWTLWECDLDLTTVPAAVTESARERGKTASKQHVLVCKATDTSYNVQPDTVNGIWNLRGINNNAWHRVKVNVLATEEDAD